jgi:hypothetical protein
MGQVAVLGMGIMGGPTARNPAAGRARRNQDFPASFPLVHARKDIALILDAAES